MNIRPCEALREFTRACGESVESGADYFLAYVGGFKGDNAAGDFHLACLNIVDVKFGVVGCIHSLSVDQKREYPDLVSAIIRAKEKFGLET